MFCSLQDLKEMTLMPPPSCCSLSENEMELSMYSLTAAVTAGKTLHSVHHHAYTANVHGQFTVTIQAKCFIKYGQLPIK